MYSINKKNKKLINLKNYRTVTPFLSISMNINIITDQSLQ